jgi:hypothetical protein
MRRKRENPSKGTLKSALCLKPKSESSKTASIMKRHLLSFLLLLSSLSVFADDGIWRVYAAYQNATQTVSMNGLVYVLSDGNLYSYDPEDTSVTTYDKSTVLSDFDIFTILPCQETKEVVIVYKNGNIDFLDSDGDVFNLPELKTKTLNMKTLNDAVVEDGMLYISLNSGIICVDVKKRAFGDYYTFTTEIRSADIYDGDLLALTPQGLYRGHLADNLLEPANWELIAPKATFYHKIRVFDDTVYMRWAGGLTYFKDLEKGQTASVFQERTTTDIWICNDKLYAITDQGHLIEVSDPATYVTYNNSLGIQSLCHSFKTYWGACGTDGLCSMSIDNDTIIQKAGSIMPDGPIRDFSYKLNLIGNRLLVAGGVFNYSGELNRRLTVMKYENGKWTPFDESGYDTYGELFYRNACDVVQDPTDPEHHFVGTARSGIYEFKNYQLVDHFTYDNSPITSILPTLATAGQYVRTTSLQFDSQRNLWFTNTECDTIIRIFKADRTWTSYYVPEIKGNPTFDHILFDERGWAWINSRRSGGNNVKAGFLVVNPNGNPGNPAGFTHKFVSQFYNQDGMLYQPVLMTSFCFDLDGALWLGYDKGLFKLDNPGNVFKSEDDRLTLTQVKVPRNDGTDLADYLLNEVPVKCIAVDGGNQKWIGTSGYGVYLISADGLETIEHFTTSNSPLINDDVYDIKINGQTGEVFIATAGGLCSYIGEATDPVKKFDKDLVKVYPNPVKPEYDGKIVVRGMMLNSDVKIVNAAGWLVNQGRSIGGTYSWDGRLSSGKRAGAGIYYILGTDEEGNNGVVGKFIMIE